MSVKNGSQQVDDELIRKIPQWIALDLLTAVAKLYLILICIRKARRVNKEIRFNLLNLHDIAAEYVEKPNLIYQSVNTHVLNSNNFFSLTLFVLVLLGQVLHGGAYRKGRRSGRTTAVCRRVDTLCQD